MVRWSLATVQCRVRVRKCRVQETKRALRQKEAEYLQRRARDHQHAGMGMREQNQAFFDRRVLPGRFKWL